MPASSNLKVLHVADAAERYGVGKFLYELVACQKDGRADIFPAVAFHVNGPRSNDFRALGIPVYESPFKTARDRKLLNWFRGIGEQYDIVNFHTHSPWGFLAAALARKRIIYTFHGAIGIRNRWTDVPMRMFHRQFIQRVSSSITFASRSSLNRYLDGVGGRFEPDKMRLFPYGIRISNVKANRTSDEMRQELNVGDRFVIGTATRMDPMKRLDRLIEAFSQLDARDRYELVIMGSGDEGYRRMLNDLVRKLDLESKVHFLGFRPDVHDVFKALDLFVLPSQEEPFGLALLEAMSLGIAVAVFADGGGPVDIVGREGPVAKTTAELARLIERLEYSESRRENAAKFSKMRSQEFDISRTAAHLRELYDK
jgi:glycosyltransferase involved in cell wall biosynthesis